jgi:hypothetical protein
MCVCKHVCGVGRGFSLFLFPARLPLSFLLSARGGREEPLKSLGVVGTRIMLDVDYVSMFTWM